MVATLPFPPRSRFCRNRLEFGTRTKCRGIWEGAVANGRELSDGTLFVSPAEVHSLTCTGSNSGDYINPVTNAQRDCGRRRHARQHRNFDHP